MGCKLRRASTANRLTPLHDRSFPGDIYMLRVGVMWTMIPMKASCKQYDTNYSLGHINCSATCMAMSSQKQDTASTLRTVEIPLGEFQTNPFSLHFLSRVHESYSTCAVQYTSVSTESLHMVLTMALFSQYSAYGKLMNELPTTRLMPESFK